MSTDVLRRNISRHLESLRALQHRGLPPITCAFSRLEGPPPGRDYRPQFSPLPYHEGWAIETVMTDAVFHPSLGVTEPYTYTSHWGSHGGNHVTAYFGSPRRPDALEEFTRLLQSTPRPPDQRDPVAEAIQTAREVSERLAPLVRALPARLAERLGFVRATLPNDWVEILFHLGWHFPDHGIEAGRFRILSATQDAPWDFRCPEPELQLGGVRLSADVFPGVIVSRLAEGSDFLTASVSALQLIQEAVEGVERAARPQPSEEFRRLHDDFFQTAEAHSHFPHELSVRVLRLADSFRTPPATEWAGIERGGDGWGIPKYYVLSHQDANRVVCELRGPGLETFQELANRAGALLPTWPAEQYPALLNDVASFGRHCDPPSLPWVSDANMWNHGMVTDHRGNVERWLGLVFGRLMTQRLEHLNLLTRPQDETQEFGTNPVNAMLTLRGMNLFAASALAIELAGLLPQRPCPETARHTNETGDTAQSPPPSSEDGAPPPACAPLIDETELAILTELRGKHPLLVKNVDIEAATKLSKQKVGQVITDLIRKKLASRPNGERKGVIATPEGIALVDRIRKSSADHP